KCIMFLTNVLLKKPKSKMVMVLLESLVTGHRAIHIRERVADKVEIIKFDPYLQEESVYRE
ncbi:hypothetical protein L9F63_027658, partial [Diploptera punctata]